MKTLTFRNLKTGKLTNVNVIHWMSTRNGIYAKTENGEWGYIPESLSFDECLFAVK